MSWNPGEQRRARIRACRWEFEGEVVRVRIDDSYDRVRFTMAGAHMAKNLPAYLLWCADYVFRHHRDLVPVRAEIKKWDREKKEEKRKRAKRQAKERKAAAARWDELGKSKMPP